MVLEDKYEELLLNELVIDRVDSDNEINMMVEGGDNDYYYEENYLDWNDENSFMDNGNNKKEVMEKIKEIVKINKILFHYDLIDKNEFLHLENLYEEIIRKMILNGQQVRQPML